MSDEIVAPEVEAEVVSAPEQEQTAVPAAETLAPEAEPKPARTFTQEELDLEIGKRLARERRKFERDQQRAVQEAVARATPQAQPTTPAEPGPDDFPSVEAYVDWKAEKKIQEREQRRFQEETVIAYREREEEARDKYEDFEQVAYNPNLRITDVMAQSIQTSDIGPDVAYFLGTNPKEADRISKLSPFMQAREIGRLEAKLATAPVPVKKTSNAPPPITPVTPRSTSTPGYDTTDPRAIQTMSTSEWIAADRARQIKKREAQRH